MTGVLSAARRQNFPFPTRRRSALRLSPVSWPVGAAAIAPGVEPVGREADHWPSFSAKVRNSWIYNPPYVLFAIVLNYILGQL
jgi:hypothetical protein